MLGDFVEEVAYIFGEGNRPLPLFFLGDAIRGVAGRRDVLLS